MGGRVFYLANFSELVSGLVLQTSRLVKKRLRPPLGV